MHYLQTGQDQCYDGEGHTIPCPGTGQDGESRRGIHWPEPRFVTRGEIVEDLLTGLQWTRDANLAAFPVTWPEALAAIAEINRTRLQDHDDWRLPNRREMRSLMSYQTRKPSLPTGHPFVNFFLGWYWTSTSAAIDPAYAWYIHLEGARMFYGRKNQYCLFWPVRGTARRLAQTGQKNCYDLDGREMAGRGSGQDGELRQGLVWPAPRFEGRAGIVHDHLTKLVWLRDTDPSGRNLDWPEALALVQQLNRAGAGGRNDWRLPNVNELESLVDCSRAQPALAAGHPFINLREGYWSATTSFFETDWAWVLYLAKGALGVGHKPGKNFSAWPVAGPASEEAG